MLRIWIEVLTRPSEQVFANEQGKSYATLSRALLWVVLGGALAVVMGLGHEQLKEVLVAPENEVDWSSPSGFTLAVGQVVGAMRVAIVGFQFGLAGMYARMWMLSDALIAFGFAFYHPVIQFVSGQEGLFSVRSLYLRPLYFMLSLSVYYWVARALGGRGQFGRYAYLMALWGVPLRVVIGLLGLLPLVGPALTEAMFGQYWYHLADFPVVYVLTWLLSFYGVGLAYLATKVEHGLVWWRAVIVVVVGYVVAFIIRNSLMYSYMGLMQVGASQNGGAIY